MRNSLSERKVRRLARETRLPIVSAMTRGGTGHRIDVTLADGRQMLLHKERNQAVGEQVYRSAPDEQ